jgi:3-phenylpropionate/trans-cinnamate dioxygenase ferredoxin subunit
MSDTDDWHRVGPAAQFPVASVRPAKVAGVLFAVGQASEGFFALEGLCPHAGAALGRGTVEGTLLSCPKHGFVFDVRTGVCQDDSECSVRAFPVRVHEGLLQIRIEAEKTT